MPSEMHPRAKLVNSARTDLSAALNKWHKTHQLTTAESIMLLTSVTGDLIVATMRLIVKLERAEKNEA